MIDRQWKRLLRDIRNNRCILLLGSRLGGIKIEEKWNPIMDAFSLVLAKELEVEGVVYNKEAAHQLPYIAQLFLHIEGVTKIDLQDEAKHFYEKHTIEIPPIYRKLATLPFTIIINTSFDNYIVRAFHYTGKLCYHHFYNFMEVEREVINPDTDSKHPIVYNLFGSIAKPTSLVITDDDQVNFVKNVVQGNPGIPSEILEHFDQSKSYIFLGFDLEHWQFRLLLESLKMRDGSGTHTTEMKKHPISEVTKTIFQKNYKFHFIDKSIDAFVEELLVKLTEFDEKDDPVKPLRKIFLYYADQDKPCAEELINYLHPLVERGELQIEHCESFLAGDDPADRMHTSMSDSNAILLLLSADFLASEGIKNSGLKYAQELQERQQVTIVPVIARACDWTSNPFLNQFAALPMHGKPIKGSHWIHVEEAYDQIVRYLKLRLW